MEDFLYNGKYKAFYFAWAGMKRRCTSPKYKNFEYWGGRGITFDPKWSRFQEFYKDMHSTYKLGLSLDRVNNDKDYSKENCRWATFKEQSNNRRTNRLIFYKGNWKTLTEWADLLGIKVKTLWQRLFTYNWSIEKAFNYRKEDFGRQTQDYPGR